MINPEPFIQAALQALPLFVCRPYGSVRIEEFILEGKHVHITVSYVPQTASRSKSVRQYHIIVLDAHTAEALSMRVYTPWPRKRENG